VDIPYHIALAKEAMSSIFLYHKDNEQAQVMGNIRWFVECWLSRNWCERDINFAGIKKINIFAAIFLI